MRFCIFEVSMTKSKRRIFNYRPMCLAALALVAGILIAEALFGEHTALIAIPIGAGVIALTLLLIFKKTRKFFYIPLALLVGFASMSISSAVYESKIEYTNYSELLDMTATVSSVIQTDGENTTFYVEDIYIDNERLKFDGQALVYFDIEPDFNAGDTIYMRGYVLGTSHTKFNSGFAGTISDGVGYRLYISKISKRAEGKLSFPENLQHEIKKMFYTVLDGDEAALCTALVIGDKVGMDAELKQGIQSAGLAHILAVSGLHITTLATALYFVLKKLKVKPWISLVVVTILTFVYAALCSFTSSALRAFVMSAVFNAASSFGKKRDNLSALALAGILILVFRPTALLELGFLLSFSSMLGIFLFHKSIADVGMKVVNKVSPKRHIGQKTVNLLAATLSASLMSYPFVAYYFGYLPTFQILSNLIFVPYMMAVYVVLLVVALLALITTFHPLVIVMQVLLFPFKHYVLWVGGLSFARIPLPSMAIPAIVLYLLIAVFFSRFNFISKRNKARGGILAIAGSVALCAALALV